MKVEKLKKITSVFASLFLVGTLALGSFTSCSNDDGDDEDKKTEQNENKNEESYSISFENFDPSKDVFSVAPNETQILKVTGTPVGTWIIDTENVPSQITVTKNNDGNFEIKGGAEETAENVSFTIMPQEAGEDTSFDKEIKVSVYNPNFTLKLNLSDELKAKASTIKVAYKDGDSQDSHSYTADATYTAGEASATVDLPKANANSSGYFTGIAVTVYDSENNIIKTDLSKNAWVCFYSTNADYYTEVDLTENVYVESTLTINFVNFTLASTDTVKVTYGITADSKTKEVDAEISSDGTKATVTIGNDYLNASGWLEVSVAITKDGKSFTDFDKSGNGWFEFKTEGITETLTKKVAEIGTYTELYSKEYTGTGGFEKIESITIPEAATTLKVEYANISGTGDWWFQVNADGTTWNVCTANTASNTWDSSIKGHSVVITDETLIASLKNTGFYFAAASGISGTLKISSK